MASEEIIQRLLDEKKISVKEALIILKDLARIGINEIFKPSIPTKPDLPTYPRDNVVVMYGVTTNPYTWNESEPQGYSISASTNDSK